MTFNRCVKAVGSWRNISIAAAKNHILPGKRVIIYHLIGDNLINID